MRYQVGGGEAGNVAADSITVMKHSIGYLEAVTNPYSASGGCDLETVDEVKLRGPHMLKTRNRAVTAEDFEWLAIEASNSVARVKALPSLRQQGEVVVVVVPRVPKGADGRINLGDKPIPSQELLGRVRRFLEDRKLLTTVVRVVRPSYVELSVEVRIVRSPSGSPDRIKREIESSLRRFLHPLAGGRNGKGWPFGRSVYKADLYHVVEEVSGVDFVDMIRIVDSDHRREVDQLRLQPHELVFLTHVDITEIAQERIV
jgi:predicted phage baseplate assembly protein